MECFSAQGCSGGNRVNTVSTISECCLGERDDGLYYTSNGGACTQCFGECSKCNLSVSPLEILNSRYSPHTEVIRTSLASQTDTGTYF